MSSTSSSSSSSTDSSDYDGKNFYIKKEDKNALINALKELAARQKALRGVAYSDNQENGRRRNREERRVAREDFWEGFMQELDKILKAMCKKSELSKKKLQALIVSKGICLSNGVEYGKHLRETLLKSKKLRIPIDSTRSYEFAR